MRIVLTQVAAQLLQLPWLKSIGALLVVVVGKVLLARRRGDAESAPRAT